VISGTGLSKKALLTRNWLRGQLHFSIPSTSNSAVNMMIAKVMYWFF